MTYSYICVNIYIVLLDCADHYHDIVHVHKYEYNHCEYPLFCLLQSLFDHIPVGVGSKGVIPMNTKYVNTYTCCIISTINTCITVCILCTCTCSYMCTCMCMYLDNYSDDIAQFYNNNYCVEYITHCIDKCMVPYGGGDYLRTCMWAVMFRKHTLVCLGPQEVHLGSISS